MQEIEQLLRQTLDDWRLSRGERRALDAALNEIGADEHQLAVVRAQAFKLLHDETMSRETKQALEWLEDVVKALTFKSDGAPASTSAYFSPSDNCPQVIENLFDQTRSKADVCVFTITDDRITEAILRAAKRGVTLRILTDDEKSQDLGSDTQRLHTSGVEVRTDRSQYHMHHKFAVFDDRRVLTGSYNWTRGAAEYNQENFIVTDDPQAAQRFCREFDRLWEEFPDDPFFFS